MAGWPRCHGESVHVMDNLKDDFRILAYYQNLSTFAGRILFLEVETSEAGKQQIDGFSSLKKNVMDSIMYVIANLVFVGT